jgi:tryptophan synthase alpha chain
MLQTTGGDENVAAIGDYLGRVSRHSSAPVCAGFGIGNSRQVAALAPYVDGVVVGSALLEVIERGNDPVRFLEELTAPAV